MNPRILSSLVLFPLIAGTSISVTLPCIWDSDTLADEVRGLPGAQDLVTGRWFRHGKAYYQKRIETLPARIEEHPDELELYDDLAVAYERLRDRDAAIAVMRKKKKALDRHTADDTIKLDQLYRYHANLGTFYAHKGEFDKALQELETAVKINPAAHFGRERYQIDLIRYVAACKKDRSLWTTHDYFTFSNRMPKDRSFFSITGSMSYSARFRANADTRKAPWKEMYTATAGMLRFGGLEGAELYRSLGDLFLARRDLNLAWWAYQVAITNGHPAEASLRQACKGIEKHWKEANANNRKKVAAPDSALFRKVQVNSRKWLITFQDAEKAFLEAGQDTSKPDVLSKIAAKADEAVPRILPLPTPGSKQTDGEKSDRNGHGEWGARGEDRLEKKGKSR